MSDEPTKYYFRQRQQNRIYDTVVGAIETAARRDNIRKKDIATKLGVPPSQVTRLLSGPANWTIDTVSDLLFSIDAEMDFDVVRFGDRVKENRFHPIGERHQSPTPSRTSPTVAALIDRLEAWINSVKNSSLTEAEGIKEFHKLWFQGNVEGLTVALDKARAWANSTGLDNEVFEHAFEPIKESIAQFEKLASMTDEEITKFWAHD